MILILYASRIATVTSVLLVISFVSDVLYADQKVLTDDGREVLLKDDGSWRFLSKDRFANTGDGQRVRLKDDGTWVYTGNAPLVSSDQVRTEMIDIRLDKAVIEVHEVKVQKNTRINSQSVFYLTLTLSRQADQPVSITEKDAENIRVSDSKRRQYTVLSLKPSGATVEPGAALALAVRVDGSPQWWKNVKTMTIDFQPGLFGLERAVTLESKVDDMVKKKVAGFEQH